MPTPVIFRKFRSGRKEIIAIFPTIPVTNDPLTCLSYMHVGQHGSASGTLTSVTTLAKPAEYAPLLKELRSVGYKGLVIRKKATYNDYLARKKELQRIKYQRIK